MDKRTRGEMRPLAAVVPGLLAAVLRTFFVALLLASCAAQAPVGHGEGPGELSVKIFSEGKVGVLLRISFEFSRPMVAKEKVGDLLSEPGLLSIEPSVNGEATWEDAKTLVFVPTQILPLSTEFVAKVAATATALDGSDLGSEQTIHFASERLSARISTHGSSHFATPDQKVSISFNQEVAPDSVKKNCFFHASSESRDATVGNKVWTKLSPDPQGQPSKHFVVMPEVDLPKDADWTLTCLTSLRGLVGNRGLASNVSEAFHTFGPLLYHGFKASDAAKASKADIVPLDNLSIEFKFSNPLKKPYQLEITPAVSGFPERCSSFGRYSDKPYLSCEMRLQAQTDYRVKIHKEQEDEFGQTLGHDQVIEFHTSSAQPSISMESGFTVAELANPVLPIWTINVDALETRIVKLSPKTFFSLRSELDWWSEAPIKFDTKKARFKVHKETLAPSGEKDKWKRFELHPAKLVGDAPGPGMYYVEVGSPEVEKYPYENGGVRKTLVNFTDLGVVSKLSPSQGLVWVTTLSSGKPLAGAKVVVRGSKGKVSWSGTTDAKGLATLPGEDELLRGSKGKKLSDSWRIFVSKGDDWTLLDPNKSGGLSAWNFNVATSYGKQAQLRGFMHTDRGLYRPGDTVHLKGLARLSKLGGDLSVPAERGVVVEIRDPRGAKFKRAELTLSKFGGFWTDIELPDDARLGDYRVTTQVAGGYFTQRFSVEEFRAATFEVSSKALQTIIVRQGDLQQSIVANYFYGAPVRKGVVKITTHSRPRVVQFTGHEGFRFDDERRFLSYRSGSSSYSQTLLGEQSLALSSVGKASVRIPVHLEDMHTDADLLVRTRVTSPANEVISKTVTVPYFHSRRYFGLKPPSYFLGVHKPQEFQVIGLLPNGKATSAEVEVTVTRKDWNCVWEEWGYRGSYQCKTSEEVVLDAPLRLRKGRSASFAFTPKKGGEYWVVIKGQDEDSVVAQQYYAWGDGGGSWESTDSMSFDIIANKKTYKAGDTATLLLKTNLSNASGLVTIERDGVIERRLITLDSKNKSIQVPIVGKYAPNIYVSVALVQGRMGDGPKGKPRMRMGLINLPVRPEDNKLHVSVTTERTDYRPGDKVVATIKVTNAAGEPVSAEVALTAADEGVLSLIGYKTPNPIPTFYSPWGLGVQTATQMAYLREIPSPNTERPATGGDSGGPGSVRSRFLATAIWKPGLVTNARGIVKVNFAAPDNLTAFRVMAVAADKGHRFGSADQRFTVSKPLQLMRLLPRFLTQGDTLRGGVVIHNETGEAGEALVTLVADSGVAVEGPSTQKVVVAVGAQVPVLFSMTAKAPGTSELLFSVKMQGESDTVSYQIPVHHPSPLRSFFVAHGRTDSKVEIPIAMPRDADPSSVQVLISVDPNGLAGLEKGLRDLIGYPYGCLEQTTSKIIPMIALRGLAESLRLPSLSGTKLDEFVKAGVAKIGRHQLESGGFSLWPGGKASAYYTAYALWGLHLAKEAGYSVQQSRIDEGLQYLRWNGTHPNISEIFFNPHGNAGDQAFALYVRALLGDKDSPGASKLLEDADSLPLYGQAFALRVLAMDLGPSDPAVKALVARLGKVALAAGAKAKLISEKNDDTLRYYMSSSLRTTAIVLDTLVAVAPEHPAIGGLVDAIMRHRRDVPYRTTQGNLYSLLALTHYAATLTSETPTAHVELGGAKLIDTKLAGKNQLRIAAAAMPEKEVSVTIRSDGTGTVHYNIELRYRSKVETLTRVDHGLALEREYLSEAGEAKSSFKVGDIVKVRLTLPLTRARSHLMISDAIPAGFEVLNTRFATVADSSEKMARRSWGDFREIHDERVDFASTYTWGHTRVREYRMRAIAEGHFIMPPSRAELMYEPKINSQTTASTIDVEAQ